MRQASETGQLYGSVSPRDLADAADRRRLHGRPQSDRAQRADQDDRPAQGAGAAASGGRGHVTVNVARSADEAERLARGEDVTVRREGGEEEDEAEAAAAAAEAFFEPGAGEAKRKATKPPRGAGEGLTAVDVRLEDVESLAPVVRGGAGRFRRRRRHGAARWPPADGRAERAEPAWRRFRGLRQLGRRPQPVRLQQVPRLRGG